jgi:chromate reductase, NAD(P)H dehydrogenase (quinone)
MKQLAPPVRLLAISGSLRVGSSNTALLRAAVRLAPAGVEIAVYDKLGDLPHFNPDLEGAEPPVVKDFCTQVGAADGIVISTPEYAHGIPGVLKNALDWLVGGFDFINKPVVFFNASLRSTYALASLTEIITIMSGRLVAEASISVPLRELRVVDEAGIVAHVDIASMVRSAILTFVRAIESKRAASATDE